jgi:hypothetical protein
MSCENNEQIDLIRGITYDATVRWETKTNVYKAITGISQAAPVVIQSDSHGVLPGWRVAIVSVKGMDEINALNKPPKDSEYHKATVPSANAISLNDVNAADYSAYKSGGYIQYFEPEDLTDFTARMQIRASINAEDTLDEFTTEDIRLPATGILIDETNKTITINIAASVTEDYTFTNAVYSLEMISPDGVVSRIISGDVVCTDDVTR